MFGYSRSQQLLNRNDRTSTTAMNFHSQSAIVVSFVPLWSFQWHPHPLACLFFNRPPLLWLFQRAKVAVFRRFSRFLIYLLRASSDSKSEISNLQAVICNSASAAQLLTPTPTP